MSRGPTMSREGVCGSLVQKAKWTVATVSHCFVRRRARAAVSLSISQPASVYYVRSPSRDPAGRDKYAIMLNCSHGLSIRMWGEAPYRCEKAKWPFAKVSQITVNSVSDSHFSAISRSVYYSGVFGCGLRCAYAARMITLLCGPDF